MTIVELYSKDDCHLCDVARDILHKVQRSIPFELNVIKIQEGDGYYEQYKERIPVVLINKEFAFQYRIREVELIAKLKSASRTVQKRKA